MFKKLIAVTFLGLFIVACDPVSDRDDCSMEGLFTSSWWEICI